MTTFQYRCASGSDCLAFAMLMAIHRPSTRRVVITLLLLLMAHAAILSYFKEDRDIARAGNLMAEMIVVVPLIAWLLLRVVAWRISRNDACSELQQVTISPDGFQVRTSLYDVRYAWAAVSKVIVSKKYVYVLLDCTNPSGFAFAAKGFELPEFAWRLCNEIETFISPGRIVFWGNRDKARPGGWRGPNGASSE